MPALRVNRRDSAEKTTHRSEIVFLLQVSRPGLWSTTALFAAGPWGFIAFANAVAGTLLRVVSAGISFVWRE